jgi:nucleotide-binding universal stress UspA family protein
MELPVVVGCESSEHDADAIAYAAREAHVRRVPLRLVEVGRSSKAALDDVVVRLSAEHPGLIVTTTAPTGGDPVQVLSAASRDASLLVVDGHAHGDRDGRGDPTPGSAVFDLLRQAECPVVVVRGESAAAIRRIMVGVDVDAPSDSSEMLGFAVAEGLLHDAEIYAIHVWEDPENLYGTDAREFRIGRVTLHDSRRERLAAILDPWERKHPDLIIAREVFPGSPGRLLVAATRLSDTLVIGGRARWNRPEADGGPPAGMRIGALADTVLRHARCPVTMVPVG